MVFTNDEFIEAVKRKEIVPYENDLITHLRNFTYEGIPLSVIVLCFPICNSNCYPTAIYLTKGMSYFKLIRGNINIYPKNLEFPNHSWVEKDGYVYDPTDGFKWKSELYYRVFKPEVLEVYDEVSIQGDSFYQDATKRLENKTCSKEALAMTLQYIEGIELKEPSMNHTMLLEEIKNCRNRYHITEKYPDSIMKKYYEMMEDETNIRTK